MREAVSPCESDQPESHCKMSHSLSWPLQHPHAVVSSPHEQGPAVLALHAACATPEVRGGAGGQARCCR